MTLNFNFLKRAAAWSVVALLCAPAYAEMTPPPVFRPGAAKQAQAKKRSAKTFAGAPVNIAGTILYTGTNRMDGMYSFATDATELTPLAIGEKYNASMGGVMANGRYFSSYQVDWWELSRTTTTIFSMSRHGRP